MKLPKGWHWEEVAELAEINPRALPANTPKAYAFRYIDISCVNKGQIDWPKDTVTFSESPSRARRLVSKGDVIMSLVRPNLQGFAIIKDEPSHTIVSTGFAVLSPKKHCAGTFLYQSLFGGKLTLQVARLIAGSNYPALSASDVENLVIAAPKNVAEQQKIADILGTWDEALEKLDALIAAKGRRKQGLMQQLLTGQRRLPGFGKPWKRVELSEVADECSIRNGQKLDRTRLYAVTKAEGMVPMRENVQGSTINRCQIVERGWFAYDPMRINIGYIARWEKDDPVMVSPDYVVFRTRGSLLLSDYLNHVRRAAISADFVGTAGNGSVRIRIWFDDLGYFKFPLPPVEEQRAIAAILSTADAELRLLRQQRAAIDHQKRGLMQLLLTGKVRVSP